MAERGIKTKGLEETPPAGRFREDSFLGVLDGIAPAHSTAVEMPPNDVRDMLSVNPQSLNAFNYIGFDANLIRSTAIEKLSSLTSLSVGILVALNGTKRIWDRQVPTMVTPGKYVVKRIAEIGLNKEKSLTGNAQMERTTLTPSRLLHAFACEISIWIAKTVVYKRVPESRVPAACQHAAVASLPWDETQKNEVREFAKQFSYIINQQKEKDRERAIRVFFSEQIFEQQWASRTVVKLNDSVANELKRVMAF